MKYLIKALAYLRFIDWRIKVQTSKYISKFNEVPEKLSGVDRAKLQLEKLNSSPERAAEINFWYDNHSASKGLFSSPERVDITKFDLLSKIRYLFRYVKCEVKSNYYHSLRVLKAIPKDSIKYVRSVLPKRRKKGTLCQICIQNTLYEKTHKQEFPGLFNQTKGNK